MPTTATLAERVRELDGDFSGLIDSPDCLAELEFTFSVFRFRYTWGTVYEVTFTNLADSEDKSACWALVPDNHVTVDCVETDTTGVGYNGVTCEVTHRLAVDLI